LGEGNAGVESIGHGRPNHLPDFGEPSRPR
jgi:hypothetical protein